MTNMTTQFLNLRKKKKQIKEFLRDEKSRDIIKNNIDSRCLKLININDDSLILKANKRLRDCNNDAFFDNIYIFLITVLNEYGLEIDSVSLSLITEINYNKDDYRIIIEL